MNNTATNYKKIIKFSGQHADEFVISEIKPSQLVLAAKMIYKIVSAIFLMIIFWLANTYLLDLIGDYRMTGTIIIFIATALWCWLSFLSFNQIRTYLTDRRIVHFEPSSPFAPSKKSLFWREVIRAKDSDKFSIWNVFKIGTVHIISYDATASAEITLPYVFHSQDLTTYIDKLIFSFKQNAESLTDMPPFEPDPSKRVYLNTEKNLQKGRKALKTKS